MEKVVGRFWVVSLVGKNLSNKPGQKTMNPLLIKAVARPAQVMQSLTTNPLEITMNTLAQSEGEMLKLGQTVMSMSQIPLAQSYQLELLAGPHLTPEATRSVAAKLFSTDPRLLDISIKRVDQNFDLNRKDFELPIYDDSRTNLPAVAIMSGGLVALTAEYFRDRFLGSHYGVLLGDTVGLPFEFVKRETMKEKPATDLVGHGSHKKPAGTWSDDGSTTLGLADSLASVGFDPIYQGLAYIRWLYGAVYSADNTIFDVGGTTGGSIQANYQGESPAWLAGDTDERSNGNGSLMRTAPLIFHGMMNGACGMREEDLRALFHQSCVASGVTHRHPRSQLACAIYTNIGRRLVIGTPLVDAVRSAKEDMLKFMEERPEVREEWNHFDLIWKPYFFDLEEEAIRSSTYVVASLEAALWGLGRSHSFREAVLTAVNLGGDTDTIGAITGGLAGIIYGYDALPEEWLQQLPQAEMVAKIVEGHYTAEMTDGLNAQIDAIIAKYAERNWFKSEPLSLIEPVETAWIFSRKPPFSDELHQALFHKLSAVISRNLPALIDTMKTGGILRDGITGGWRERSEAARYLGIESSEEALQALQQPEDGFNDEVWMVRGKAGAGLAANGSETSLRLLQQSGLLEDEMPKVTYMIINSLGKSEEPAAHQLLISWGLHHERSDIRQRTRESLEHTDTHQTRAALGKLTD